MWSGKVRVTKVARLVEQLPDGARVYKARGDDRAWTNADHLLAAVVDTLTWANFQRGEGKGDRPKPVPRPAEAKARNDKALKQERLALEAARRMKPRSE